MVRTLLVRGLLLGLLAGLVAGVFAFTLGEPRVDDAIALENAAAAHEHGGAHGHEAAGRAHEHGEEVGRGTRKAGLGARLVPLWDLGGIVRAERTRNHRKAA